MVPPRREYSRSRAPRPDRYYPQVDRTRLHVRAVRVLRETLRQYPGSASAVVEPRSLIRRAIGGAGVRIRRLCRTLSLLGGRS